MKDPNTARDIFTSLFTHAIGDLVVVRHMVAAYRTEIELGGPRRSYEGRIAAPPGMVVLERTLHECHGGIQAFYSVRRWTHDGTEVRANFAELELVPYAEAVEALRGMVPQDDGPIGPKTDDSPTRAEKIASLERRLEALKLLEAERKVEK